MEDSKVVSLKGDAVPQLGEPNAACVAALEEWLERAKSGEIVGVALIGLASDKSGAWRLGGILGSYSMIGAACMVKDALMQIAKE